MILMMPWYNGWEWGKQLQLTTWGYRDVSTEEARRNKSWDMISKKEKEGLT